VAQEPAAANSGPAPVPFAGGGLAPDSSGADPDVSATAMPGGEVMGGTAGHVAESPLAAPNVNPHEAGSLSPVFTGGDPNPAGSDDVAATAAAAVAAAQARAGAHQQDTYGQGSQVGDQMDLPPQDFSVPNAHGTGYGGQE
jgi:hypothetical protein